MTLISDILNVFAKHVKPSPAFPRSTPSRMPSPAPKQVRNNAPILPTTPQSKLVLPPIAAISKPITGPSAISQAITKPQPVIENPPPAVHLIPKQPLPIILNEIQEEILKALDGKLLKTGELVSLLGWDQSQVFRDGLTPLRKLGLIINIPRKGYYRPDKQPLYFAKYANLIPKSIPN